MDLSIIIINYRSSQFLKMCLASVFGQITSYTYEVIVIDNGSESLTSIKKEFPEIILFHNKENVGFSTAVNQGIAVSLGVYVMTLNPDVILENEYIEKCITTLSKNPKLSSVTGKLLHYNFEKNEKTNVIDSTGIIMKKNRHAYDRGQGEVDAGQYDTMVDVWGVSAAAAVYRKEALGDIKDRFGYFDNRFFMYKEDVDVAWRFQKKGWKSTYIPQAIAYHKRGTGIIDTRLSTITKFSMGRKSKSKEMRRLSFQNQLLLQKKNDTYKDIIKECYVLIPYWLITFLYMLIVEPSLLKRNNKK